MSDPIWMNMEGPEIPHGDARIVMSVAAAVEVMKAIGRAATTGEAQPLKPTPSDGETYDLVIEVKDDPREFWEQGYPEMRY